MLLLFKVSWADNARQCKQEQYLLTVFGLVIFALMELFSQNKLRRHALTISLIAAGCTSVWAQSFAPAEIGAEQEQRRALERKQQKQQQLQDELEHRQRQAVQALEAQVGTQDRPIATDLGHLPLLEDERASATAPASSSPATRPNSPAVETPT